MTTTEATPSRVAIAGASGLIGHALAAALRARGAGVTTLVRRAPRNAEEVYWNPATGELDATSLEGVHAVVNLAGENIAAGRWTAARRERIRRSRIDATRTLVGAIGRLEQKPAVLANASAIGIYGDRGGEVLTEDSALAEDGFLAEVCRAWETEADAVNACGVRLVRLRFGVVLARDGGALAKLLPVFRAGLGGRVGNGRQWMSWIALEDAVGAIVHALETPACRGPMNVVAPGAVTNAEFTAALARALRRPAMLPVPAWGLRVVFGRMAEETLLASARAEPRRLVESGYTFRHPELAGALAAVLTVQREAS